METEVTGTLNALLKRPSVWPVTTIEVPGKGRFWVREITAGQRDHLEALTRFAQTRPQAIRGEFRAQFVAYFLSDANGARLVSDDDIEKVDQLSHHEIDLIYREGLSFNKLSDDEGELEKN